MRGPVCASIVTAMTDTSVPVGTTRPLVRRDDDKVVAGICAAFGRYTDTDPVLWRVVLGVLTFFGGVGLALYVAGWLLIPRAGHDASIGERALRGGRLTPGSAVVVGLLVVLAAVALGDGRGLAAVAVIGVLAYLVARDRRDGIAAPDAPSVVTPGPAGTTYAGGWGAPVVGPPAPPRPPSRLGGVVLALTALTGGVLLALRLAGVEELTAARILAVCLCVVGAGLVVGTVVGRARWLFFFPGLVLALALAATVAVDGVVDGGVGERTWTIAGGAPTRTFELGLGEATLDLRGADTSGQVLQVDARVGVGHLVVLVPEDLTVRIRADVGLGEIDTTDVGGSTDPGGGTEQEQELVVGSGDVEAELDLEVGTGQVEVRRG